MKRAKAFHQLCAALIVFNRIRQSPRNGIGFAEELEELWHHFFFKENVGKGDTVDQPLLLHQ